MSDARFTRRIRLVSKADYQQVFAQPGRSADVCFTILTRPNTLGFPRLGLAISRKAAKLAVVRNRVKRVVRESFRQQQQRLGGIDIVVMGRFDLSRRDNPELFDSLERHWTRITGRRLPP